MIPQEVRECHWESHRLLEREGRIQWKVKCRESTFLLLPLSPRVASDCSKDRQSSAKQPRKRKVPVW
ncbi:hypothetical protein CEXT_704171 [Caerostris extrusa]|uniref:Uncharacterized protein n=1 Tax=Caerostris extrusa TaxID=172846 RepID=A0AAV4W8G6_CAEEX|nr:hypothetical protein CEXT_704171 [Caerostris extrusa]